MACLGETVDLVERAALVTNRGWDPEDYQNWLTLTLERTLLQGAKPV